MRFLKVIGIASVPIIGGSVYFKHKINSEFPIIPAAQLPRNSQIYRRLLAAQQQVDNKETTYYPKIEGFKKTIQINNPKANVNVVSSEFFSSTVLGRILQNKLISNEDFRFSKRLRRFSENVELVNQEEDTVNNYNSTLLKWKNLRPTWFSSNTTRRNNAKGGYSEVFIEQSGNCVFDIYFINAYEFSVLTNETDISEWDLSRFRNFSRLMLYRGTKFID
ncbi:uncharacterized protein SCDLUD_003615 [Saccharomycodes ludwigii]|uniref:uncharacterized protein n=1 Tax=Saccharomycodes ludwigii TaxID=36035 RepID=UPI001E8A5501|nr:hypothetical protein SCDLUD_003615 [Saccharomycodes ludwigii]KAH3900622.1 hypothetical protein SCDLUD_003615 [Saccharomycodes ludwigii]